MATNPLTYSISSDFGGSFNSTNFSAAVSLPVNGVERNLSHINTDGDEIKVHFVGAGDIAQADVDKIQGASYPSPIGGLIDAHDATPVDPDPLPVNQTFEVDPHRACLDGVTLQVTASSWAKEDYSMPESLHLNEARVHWSGCFKGDYGYTCMIHPASQGSLAASASQGASQVDVGSTKVGYFNPTVGATDLELWDENETTLLEVHKIDSISGNMVVFDGTVLAAARDTSVKMKARYGSFSPSRGTNRVEGGLPFHPSSGVFPLDQGRKMTDIIPTGMILSSRVRTTADAGTRDVTVIFKFRTPA